MTTIHILNGTIGSGKTTYAKQIEAKSNAVRFTVDEWMLVLFGEADMERDVFESKIKFLETQFKTLAESFINNNVDVIMDFGGWGKSDRDQMRVWANTLNCELNMVYFDTPFDVCKSRVLKRTQAKTENNYMFDEQTIDTLFGFFEIPEANEEFHEIVK
ncbi:MAG: ATP-binding protein [Saccharospirillaceae bacterium]|nr:ATP-binding protein [Pseudomonadales bacterium]NRB79780.1 ATP-binding protein [Saccharospirillaceae bacterium]